MFLVALSDTDRRAIERTIRDAIRMANMTMDRSAREAEMSQAQWTRQVQLTEGTLKRLGMQPRSFWQWWAIGLAAHYGLPREAMQAYRLHRLAKASTRMARMELKAQQQNRRSA